MTEQHIKELLSLQKKFYHQLVEASQLTEELLDTINRQDQVTLSMLLSLRQRAILEMQEIAAYLDLLALELDKEAALRLKALQEGSPAQTSIEQPLVDRLSTNRRLFDRLIALDKRLNEKLCGDQSFYAT